MMMIKCLQRIPLCLVFKYLESIDSMPTIESFDESVGREKDNNEMKSANESFDSRETMKENSLTVSKLEEHDDDEFDSAGNIVTGIKKIEVK
jgi:hypothetical protein